MIIFLKTFLKILSPDELYLRSIYFLLHGHSLTIVSDGHSHELPGVSVYEYGPDMQMVNIQQCSYFIDIVKFL